MKYILLFNLFLMSCSPFMKECDFNSDCDSDKICQKGMCEPMNDSQSIAKPLAGCNTQVIKCNCEKPKVHMGEVMSSDLCQSGKQRLYFCEEDCGQWFYWTAYCYCE